jgi:ubiquinone/menaquinone biosynthesis C-methylase UbiE
MKEITDKMEDFEIRSYGDFRRLIRGQTSKSMHRLYDDLYFKKHVGDKMISESYFNTLGLAETKYTQIPLGLAEIKPGERIIDIGCGRGEIVFQAANAGAFSIGVDYAESAVEIARVTREKHGDEIREKTGFICSSAENLQFEDNFFDTAFLLDVVEHVSKSEFCAILKETRRILKPGGKLIIHTSPNLWSRTWGYRVKAAVYLFLKGKIPVHPIVAQYRALKTDPEYDEHKILLHINEQSIHSLKSNLKFCGFSSHIWLGNTGNPWILRKDFFGKTLSAIYKISGLKFILGMDIYAVAKPVKT